MFGHIFDVVIIFIINVAFRCIVRIREQVVNILTPACQNWTEPFEAGPSIQSRSHE